MRRDLGPFSSPFPFTSQGNRVIRDAAEGYKSAPRLTGAAAPLGGHKINRLGDELPGAEVRGLGGGDHRPQRASPPTAYSRFAFPEWQNIRPGSVVQCPIKLSPSANYTCTPWEDFEGRDDDYLLG
jgi:hypothetical protein